MSIRSATARTRSRLRLDDDQPVERARGASAMKSARRVDSAAADVGADETSQRHQPRCATDATRVAGRRRAASEERFLRTRIEGIGEHTGGATAARYSVADDGSIVLRRRGGPAPDADDRALPKKYGDRPATLEDVRDPDHVNDDGSEADQMAAAERTARRTVDEEIALAELDETQREHYDEIAALTEGDPIAREGLQLMVLDGAFEGEDGAELLGQLHGVATDELAEGINREELVSDLVQELHDPVAIAQRGKGTCVATSSEMYLAMHDPAEYTRLVRGLASPAGRVEMVNGDTLRREGGTIEDDGSSRSITQRLLAPALMEYGNGRENYSNDDDDHNLWIIDRGSGLNAKEADRLMEAMTGETFRRENADANAEDRAALAEDVVAAANAGDVISTSLKWSDDGGHRVLVTGGDDEWVTFINPWGKTQRMSREEFDQRVKSAQFPE